MLSQHNSRRSERYFLLSQLVSGLTLALGNVGEGVTLIRVNSRYSERVFLLRSAILAIARGLFLLTSAFSDLTLALGNVREGVTLSLIPKVGFIRNAKPKPRT